GAARPVGERRVEPLPRRTSPCGASAAWAGLRAPAHGIVCPHAAALIACCSLPSCARRTFGCGAGTRRQEERGFDPPAGGAAPGPAGKGCGAETGRRLAGWRRGV